MAFLETPRFPDDIAYGSAGGPNYSTSIIVVRSGDESRNVNWSQARHSFDVSYGVRTMDQLSSLVDFFHAVIGMAHAFRFKDFTDCKSSGHYDTTVGPTDQLIGTGNGVQTDFQLIKNYTKGAFSRQRDITKPVTNTVRIAINDVEKQPGDATYPWSVNTTTGLVTFTGTPPPDTESVKAGYEFDVPCRFDSDQMSTNLEHYLSGSIEIPLIEVRDIS